MVDQAACCFEKPWIYGVEIFPFLHGGEAAIEPLYERKPEYYLWRELGIRLGQEEYWPWKDLDEAYDWIKSKKIEVVDVISHEFTLEDIGEAFRVVCEADESLKVIIVPNID